MTNKMEGNLKKVFNRMGPEPNDLGLSKYHILDGCDKSLRRLQMDHIDIYFLHCPDFSVPVEETLEVLVILVKQGRVKIHCLFDLFRLENHLSYVVNYFNTAE